jgi:hypothetical protein
LVIFLLSSTLKSNFSPEKCRYYLFAICNDMSMFRHFGIFLAAYIQYNISYILWFSSIHQYYSSVIFYWNDVWHVNQLQTKLLLGIYYNITWNSHLISILLWLVQTVSYFMGKLKLPDCFTDSDLLLTRITKKYWNGFRFRGSYLDIFSYIFYIIYIKMEIQYLYSH